MNLIQQKWLSPLKNFMSMKKEGPKNETPAPKGFVYERQLPLGHHVYSIFSNNDGQLLIGTSSPAQSQGAVFKGFMQEPFVALDVPLDVALISCFIKLKDGRVMAAGMNNIGRGVVLISDEGVCTFKHADLDLHNYSAVEGLLSLPDGSIVISVGQMMTQGKTKAVLFRSTDQGETWTKEEIKLPVSMFQSFYQDGQTIYIGTNADKDPKAYVSHDGLRSFDELPAFDAYKTYKMVAIEKVKHKGQDTLLVVLWGYQSSIADRVVRIYVLDPASNRWIEKPAIDDIHFVFSFQYIADSTLLVGTEKGRIYESNDLGETWNKLVEFPTNVGSYVIFRDKEDRRWFGKDFVAPDHRSLWRQV